jgi:hypothetical protein
MRKLEETQAKQWSTTRETRQDIPFVRAAKAGGWKAGLPEAAVAQLEAAWGHLMFDLGYELLFPKKAAAFDSRPTDLRPTDLRRSDLRPTNLRPREIALNGSSE